MGKHAPTKTLTQARGSLAPPGPNAYARALNKALEIFVSHAEQSFDDVMSNGLYAIADVANIDRLLVCRVWAKERNSAGEIYRWDRLEGGTAPVSEEMKVLPVNTALKRWVVAMMNDSCVSLRRSGFLEDEAAFLSPHGVMSILIVPVFTEGDLWGVVTFHDNKNERDFDEGCTALLRSTARLCVSTIIREEKTKSLERAMEALRRREMITNALNKASIIFLSENERQFTDIMHTGVSLIADMAKFDRLILYRNYTTNEKLYMSQVYRWDRDLGGSAELVDMHINVSYEQVLPNWETYLASGNFVNTPSRLLPEAERGILQEYGIVSVVQIPVFVANSFWGFAIFGDTHSERYFEADIIEMLHSAAFLFANAFIRVDMDYDAHTGIHNRQYYDDNMKSIIKHLSRSGDLLSLMIIDVDFFKQYNDTYGHIEGDKCLKIVAQALSHTLKREDDFVARYGGDEFVVVLPNTHEFGAKLIADKLLTAIRNCNIPHAKNQVADFVTVSIGVTTGKVAHTHKPSDFMKKADELLYIAKRDGRNRYSFEQFSADNPATAS